MDGTRHQPRAARIHLEGVRKQYPDGTVAVDDLTLDIPAGEVTVLIGPSGCGKSTVLRMINRLIEPTAGRVVIDDEDVVRADPVMLRRRVGYVIQHVGLFPHQTVRANVGTVPRLLGWPRRRIAERTEELLELVGLDPGRFGGRYPHELSGGQRQRVGVARALAADPVVLLMDEPFSAVDPIVRARLQDEFRRLQETVRKTIVLVTHDLDEAVRLGDRIAVLAEHGHLQQYERPAVLLAQPANEFVREFVGADRAIKQLGVTPIPLDSLRPLAGSGGAGAWAGAGAGGGTAGPGTAGAGAGGGTAGPGTAGAGAGTAGAAPSVAAGDTLQDALAALLASEAGYVVVRDGGEPLGILTPGDIHRALHEAERAHR